MISGGLNPRRCHPANEPNLCRNLFAEKAVTFMSIPCEFKTYGCRVEIQYKDKESVKKINK